VKQIQKSSPPLVLQAHWARHRGVGLDVLETQQHLSLTNPCVRRCWGVLVALGAIRAKWNRQLRASKADAVAAGAYSTVVIRGRNDEI
jgi:hypothetical protein